MNDMLNHAGSGAPHESAGPCVAVAMSGGVDSSAVAAILVREGYDVIGVTMIADASGKPTAVTPPHVVAARSVCEALGVPFHAVDLSAVFRDKVVSAFVSEYLEGLTPNPCVYCNRHVKFGALFEAARLLGATALATGHYARLEQAEDGPRLRSGVDPGKDQSYVLAGVTRAQLTQCLFPLGGMRKEETRRIALEMGLPVPPSPESQDICFIPDGQYGYFIEQAAGSAAPGPIITTEGRILGRHKGLVHYTVGQRKGLGIGAPRPLYVLHLDPANNTLVVGCEEETGSLELHAVDANWLTPHPPTEPFTCNARIRYHHRPVPAVVTPEQDGFTARFTEPVRSIAPGQYAVLYDGDQVLGNGRIERS